MPGLLGCFFLLQVATLAIIFTLPESFWATAAYPASSCPFRDYVWYVDRVTGCFRRNE